jgi:hypothetical protein
VLLERKGYLEVGMQAAAFTNIGLGLGRLVGAQIDRTVLVVREADRNQHSMGVCVRCKFRGLCWAQVCKGKYVRAFGPTCLVYELSRFCKGWCVCITLLMLVTLLGLMYD